MNILLASGSPRRRELLSSAQIDFITMSIDIDETPYDNESPKDYIQRMVATKADAAIIQLNAEYQHNRSKPAAFSTSFIILTADTIGVLPDGSTVLVKPTDRNHAYSMWQKMSDNTHQVWTAVQATQVSWLPEKRPKELLANPTDMDQKADDKQTLQALWQQQIIEQTEVTFVPLTPEMMADYWESGEPADKAGGYAIQGLAAAWVTHINGSYTNVVGLPLAQTLVLIDEANKNHQTSVR